MNKREYAQANRTSSESRDDLAQSMPSRKRGRAKFNKAWIEAKAQEEGVKVLPKGIYYKVLSEGRNNGRHPSPRSIVTAHAKSFVLPMPYQPTISEVSTRTPVYPVCVASPFARRKQET